MNMGEGQVRCSVLTGLEKGIQRGTGRPQNACNRCRAACKHEVGLAEECAGTSMHARMQARQERMGGEGKSCAWVHTDTQTVCVYLVRA